MTLWPASMREWPSCLSLSVAAALLSLVIPKAYLGLLGIFPILVGIRKLLELRHDRAEDGPQPKPLSPQPAVTEISPALRS